jgi:uncharacterized protein YyaL (SSP411 family)
MHPVETMKFASELAEGIRHHSLFEVSEEAQIIHEDSLHQAVKNWSSLFDRSHGGSKGSPKFPLPVNLEFLLHYGVQCGNQEVLDHVELTLTKMAMGGIYDQVGGGFARYAVDSQWKVPHFEKMLYDNAQLIGLYASAYQVFKKDLFRDVIRQSIEWVGRDMYSPEGALYSALDADSEGEEGRYYVWGEDELFSLLKDEYELFAAYYNTGDTTGWEGDTRILNRSLEPDIFAERNGLDPLEFREKTRLWNERLLRSREKRIPPGLDDKSITSWSSLMISGLVKAYRSLGEAEYLKLAISSASLIRGKCWDGQGTLYRNYKRGTASIPGFHIDYALYTEACLDLYEASLEKEWLDLAQEMTLATFQKFHDSGSGMFNYSGNLSDVLITNQVEVQDSVIPSSNSVMGHNLFRLGHLLAHTEYLAYAESMVKQLQGRFEQYPYGFANWGRLILKHLYPFFEVAVTGAGSSELVGLILKDYQPNILVAGSREPSELPLLMDRFDQNKSLIFVCRDRVCQLPVTRAEDAKAIFHIG